MAENHAELKPCPFCGKVPTGLNKTAYENPRFYSMVCNGCCSIAMGETPDKVIERWNTRADLAAPDAALWSSEIPKVNGFYWVQQGDHTPYIVEFEDGFAFFTGVERCSDHFSNDHRFLGPLHPSCLPNDQAWRSWLDRLGDKATAEVVNATANLVTDERLAALVDARVLPTAEPDAVRQAEAGVWKNVGVVLSDFGANIRKVDLIKALERERLRAEGEKGSNND